MFARARRLGRQQADCRGGDDDESGHTLRVPFTHSPDEIHHLHIRCAPRGAFLSSPAPAQPPGKYKNFRVAIYVTRGNVSQWGDPRPSPPIMRACHQVKFDKVYLEFATTSSNVHEATLEPMKKFFIDRGIHVSAGHRSTRRDRRQPRPVPIDPTALARASRRSPPATSTRSSSTTSFSQLQVEEAANIPPRAARAGPSTAWKPWKMPQESHRRARQAVNPKITLIIKYPNWYEHYQSLGYDLEAEPKIFDKIYTGTETRDPVYGDQHLQQYAATDLVR